MIVSLVAYFIGFLFLHWTINRVFHFGLLTQATLYIAYCALALCVSIPLNYQTNYNKDSYTTSDCINDGGEVDDAPIDGGTYCWFSCKREDSVPLPKNGQHNYTGQHYRSDGCTTRPLKYTLFQDIFRWIGGFFCSISPWIFIWLTTKEHRL
jgi:hypothetical protein